MPVMKELQHLADASGRASAVHPLRPVGGRSASAGLIEVVQDDDDFRHDNVADFAPPEMPSLPSRPPSSSGTNGTGHSRGRSIGGESISSKISKATSRLRSQSRSRREQAPANAEAAPYESLPSTRFHTGLQPSEMI